MEALVWFFAITLFVGGRPALFQVTALPTQAECEAVRAGIEAKLTLPAGATAEITPCRTRA